MAGIDCFSVDWIASKIMGYAPSNVRFLKIAMKEGLGTTQGISTLGEKIEDFAKIFPREGFVPMKYLWGAQFWVLKAYQKLSGDVVPPMLQEE